MSNNAFIGRVTDVHPHPESDKLDIVTIAGMTNVANRPEPDQPRYKVGDYAVVLTENLILPKWLLKHMHLWDDVKSKGVLAGSKGNRTKARKIAGVLSEVALCKAELDVQTEELESGHRIHRAKIAIPAENDFEGLGLHYAEISKPGEEFAVERYDMNEVMGIEVYQPTA